MQPAGEQQTLHRAPNYEGSEGAYVSDDSDTTLQNGKETVSKDGELYRKKKEWGRGMDKTPYPALSPPLSCSCRLLALALWPWKEATGFHSE